MIVCTCGCQLSQQSLQNVFFVISSVAEARDVLDFFKSKTDYRISLKQHESYTLYPAYFLLLVPLCLLPTALNTANYPLSAAYCLLSTDYCLCLLPTVYCFLTTAYCPLNTACCLPPTANCTKYCLLLPSAYCLLPTDNSQQHTA
jgi:hypothetical protein